MPVTNTKANKLISLRLFPVMYINNMVIIKEKGIPIVTRPALRIPIKYQIIIETKNMPSNMFKPSVVKPSLILFVES